MRVSSGMMSPDALGLQHENERHEGILNDTQFLCRRFWLVELRGCCYRVRIDIDEQAR